MKIIDLTAPLYEGQPFQHGHMGFRAHPIWPEPFKATETRSYDPDGSRFHVYTIFCEPGTRLILAGFRKDYKDGPTLDTIDLKKIVFRDAVVIDIPKGDAILTRTGWGDNERYFKMGHLYRENGPHFNVASGNKLMELMEKNGSDMYTYDMCDMSGLDKKTLTRGGFTIRAGMIALGGLVNCNAITKPRVKLIALPLKAKGGRMAPCSVVAIEE
ncbi:MAG: hypothetical protein HYY41_00505 [Chloroflexi bacterium]|nr:hypothetical protein [Chloroflexota bacterium]